MANNNPILDLRVMQSPQGSPFVDVPELQRLMNKIKLAMTGLMSTLDGNPWANPNIPTDAEKAALVELVASPTADVVTPNNMIFLKRFSFDPTADLAHDGLPAVDTSGNPVLSKVAP